MDKKKIKEIMKNSRKVLYGLSHDKGYTLEERRDLIVLEDNNCAEDILDLLPQGGEGGLVDSDTKCDLLDEFMACYSGGLDVVLQSNVSNLLDAAFKAQKLLDDINKEKEKAEIIEGLESLLSISENDLGFIDISNHVEFAGWQALKKQVLGE